MGRGRELEGIRDWGLVGGQSYRGGGGYSCWRVILWSEVGRMEFRL